VQPLSRNLNVTPEAISVADFRHRTLKRFVAICTTLPRQLLRPEVGKSLGISTPTSRQVQMEILVEKREEFMTAGYVVFCKIVSVSHTKFVRQTKTLH